MDVCCWNLNICNTEIKPYYNRQVLRDWEGNLVKKPRGEHKVNIYESGVIGMIELIEMKQKGQLEWLDDLDALNQLKQPLRFADASEHLLTDWGWHLLCSNVWHSLTNSSLLVYNSYLLSGRIYQLSIPSECLLTDWVTYYQVMSPDAHSY